MKLKMNPNREWQSLKMKMSLTTQKMPFLKMKSLQTSMTRQRMKNPKKKKMKLRKTPQSKIALKMMLK